MGGYIVYQWSRELHGDLAGLVGLALWSFCPNVIANSQTVTAEISAMTAGVAATYCFWRYMKQPTLRRALLAGTLLGLAQLTKFSLLILYPTWALLWLIWKIICGNLSNAAGDSRQNQSDPPPARRQVPSSVSDRTQLLHGLTIVGASVLVLNAGYGFEGTFTRLGEFEFVSRTLTTPTDSLPDNEGVVQIREPSINRFRGGRLHYLPVPLPYNYLLGIDSQKQDFEARFYSYLRGELRREGWWYYYLYAFAIKTPIGTLLLCAVASILTLRNAGNYALTQFTLWVPVTLHLVLVSSQTGFNHHLRYALPVLPYIFVWTSKVANLSQAMSPTSRIVLPGLCAVCVLWNVSECIRVFPHHLSYFNQFVGGPDRGHLHLLDSNIDWGQDLFALKRWLANHPDAAPINIAYYGMVDPAILDISYKLPPFGPSPSPEINQILFDEIGPKPGWYAVSVNLVHGLPYLIPDGRGGVRECVPHIYDYFRHFEPTAKAGYSIFIFRITEADANRVRRKLALPEISAPSDSSAHTDEAVM
jgi:hypothetical protein